MKNKPVAVIISDIHFSIKTRLLAKAALRAAFQKASELKTYLVIAGDLNDTKAIMRAEWVNDILELFADYPHVQVVIIPGNHDLLNEKGEDHCLNFLGALAEVVKVPTYHGAMDLWLFPYFSNVDKLREALKQVPKGATIIMHQGVRGAFMGDYAVDKTSIDPAELKDYCVISGHYHRRQTIITDDKKHMTDYGVGTFNYIGSPYTITAGEANDGDKGFRILRANNLMDFVPTNLRKHVTVERTVEDVMNPIEGLTKDDILCVKVYGLTSELDKLKKKDIGMALIGHQNFKLDKYATDTAQASIDVSKMTKEQIIDTTIDGSNETPKQKAFLKGLWRELLK